MNDNLVVTLTIGQLSSIISEIVKKEVKENIPPAPVKFLNAKEAASLLRCSAPTLRGYVKRGCIVKHKMGRKNLFKLNEVEEAAISMKTYKRNVA